MLGYLSDADSWVTKFVKSNNGMEEFDFLVEDYC